LFDRLVEEVKATDLREYKKRSLVRYIRLIERITQKEHGYAQRAARKLLENVAWRIEWYEDRGKITTTEAEEILSTIDEIDALLRL